MKKRKIALSLLLIGEIEKYTKAQFMRFFEEAKKEGVIYTDREKINLLNKCKDANGEKK